MKHFILFVYALLGSTGFAGIASLVLLVVRLNTIGRHQDGVLVKRFLSVHLLLLFGLIITIVWFYFHNIALVRQDLGRTGELSVLSVLGLLGGLSMVFLYLELHRLLTTVRTSIANTRILKRITTVLAGTTALVVGLTTILHAVELFGTLGFPADILGPLGYPLTTTTVLLFGIYCLIYDYSGTRQSVRFLGKATGVAAISYIPLTFAEMFLDQEWLQPYHPLSLDFIFYLELNLAAIFALHRELSDRKQFFGLKRSRANPTVSGFSLTGRERQMVELIAQGLANKEIAAQLDISPATVRTHVYNLFQKVGARSRIELLNRLNENE